MGSVLAARSTFLFLPEFEEFDFPINCLWKTRAGVSSRPIYALK